jgi:hypothetical protein
LNFRIFIKTKTTNYFFLGIELKPGLEESTKASEMSKLEGKVL